MFNTLRKTFRLMPSNDRITIILLSTSRALLGILDIIAIFLVGIILAKGSGQGSKSNQSESFDYVISLVDDVDLFQLTALALCLFLAKSLLATLLMKIMTTVFARVESELTTTVYKNALNSNHSKVSRFSRTEIAFGLTHSASFAITQLLTVFVIIVSEFLLLIMIAFVFALVDLRLTIYIVIYFFVIGLAINNIIGSRLQKAGARYSAELLNTTSNIQDALGAFREIYASDRQKNFALRFYESRSKLAKSMSEINFLSSIPRYIVESALMVGAAGLAAISLSSGDAASAAGTLGIFLTGGLRIMASMLPLQNALGTLRQLTTQSDSFFRLQEDFADINDVDKNVHPHLASGNVNGIILDNVSFFYPDAEYPALSSVSLRIEEGKTVAFIGKSGSGKSTLADLIVGLLVPSSGSIHINESLRKSIAYVPQSPGIITGTISQNIVMNPIHDDVDTETLNTAISMSHLRGLIDELELGADTDLGAQLDDFSGGQLQRIGLARSIYSKPKLLILDEATSALDAETESAVTESLKTLRGNCTIIIIAHRLSTIQDADVVFLFDEGELVASGTFAELVAENPLVAKYVELSEIRTTD
jgi:ABC-type multidrug transport system fused ATPase/permease subunit